MSKKYSVQEFKQILPSLPWAFEAWVDHNPHGEGARVKLKFIRNEACIYTNHPLQDSIKRVDYSWSGAWLGGTYKGTFELVDSPLQHTKPIVYEVGDTVEILENARDCGTYVNYWKEGNHIIGNAFPIYARYDNSDGVAYEIIDSEVGRRLTFPHYCVRKIENKPEEIKKVTLELTDEQLEQIQAILKS